MFAKYFEILGGSSKSVKNYLYIVNVKTTIYDGTDLQKINVGKPISACDRNAMEKWNKTKQFK